MKHSPARPHTIALIVALLLSLTTSFAQRSARADYEFGTYLLGKGLMREATTLTCSLSNDYTPEALDTMRYLRGWTLYHQRQFAPAAKAFAEVGQSSTFYPKSALFGALCNIESGSTEEALSVLNSFAQTPMAQPYHEMVDMQRGAIALIEGDRELYNHYQQSFTYTDNILLAEQRRLDEIATAQMRTPKKWVAGLASAVVPGLGQIYAGNVGEGVATLLMVGAFTALTVDSWNNAGTPANWRTIAYGSVASLLYIGNIFGSVASVNIYYQNFEKLNHEAVMYSIHIPLRAIFD